MTVSVNLSEEALALVEEYARRQDISVSEFIRRTLLEKLEDEEDTKAADKAMEDYVKNPVSFTHDEVWGEVE